MTSLPLPCAHTKGCTVPSTEAVTLLGRVYCSRHALVACAEALAAHRRMTGQDLFDCLDILRAAVVQVQFRLRVLGIDSKPQAMETP